MKKTKPAELIPALGYFRKSTKGEREGKDGKRRERQEKSIPQQKAEVEKLADDRSRAAFTSPAAPGAGP